MKRWIKVSLIGFVILVVVLAGGFLIYVSDYYRSDATAAGLLQAGEGITQSGNTIILTPPVPSETALIFYPGGKVEEASYLPLLNQLRQDGLTCVLVTMPFNLAVFDANAADAVIASMPQIKTWYIGGHSLGGAMASDYADRHQDKIKGLVLLAAYIYGDLDPAKALTLYGTEDQVLDTAKITYTENVVAIPGGNHAYFGNYGEQSGDGQAAISREEQQSQTVAQILTFIGEQD